CQVFDMRERALDAVERAIRRARAYDGYRMEHIVKALAELGEKDRILSLRPTIFRECLNHPERGRNNEYLHYNQFKWLQWMGLDDELRNLPVEPLPARFDVFQGFLAVGEIDKAAALFAKLEERPLHFIPSADEMGQAALILTKLPAQVT